MSKKDVYFFGDGRAEGGADMKALLGGKGANLAEMVNLHIPVPPGFTITTEVCAAYYEKGKKYPDTLRGEVDAALRKVEGLLGKKFGDAKNPLLLSVRSGARVSMPGMMDTILNLGLNDETVEGLAAQSGNPRFAFDSYRRFIQMYANVVLGINSEPLEHALEARKRAKGLSLDTELSAQDLKSLVDEFKLIVEKETGKKFPSDPGQQLWSAIDAVFASWMSKRAIEYRRIHKISEHWGTAVNVQSMVFGNLGDDCATGVAFTRDPSTGERRFFGEFLVNAQGEDVVAGIRTPIPIDGDGQKSGAQSLSAVMPECYRDLVSVYQKLESHYRDMQDIEFTIERKKLWMLQTRTGKRTAQAAVRIAVEMVEEGLISKEEAILRVDAGQIDQLLHPMIDETAKSQVLAKGLPASPGAASGEVVFSSEDAEQCAKADRKCVLVRLETSPEDIHGMNSAVGILTARGGMTSHAAVVARGMGKCCVVGCSAIVIDYPQQLFEVGGVVVKKGDWITLNGSTGEVLLGKVPTVQSRLSQHFDTFMDWVDGVRRLKVRANADTPHDSEIAINFKAEGIGLCRTEHMFFEGDRIEAVRQMILSETAEGRRVALEKILPMQREDFVGIYRAMKGRPVTIRLLDPPLHEFLPQTEEEIRATSVRMGVPYQELANKVKSLHEFNPMLGHRGCRLGVTYPEIYEMQVRAIAEAAIRVSKELGQEIVPEIMIPLVSHANELARMRKLVEEEFQRVMAEQKGNLRCHIGTMIELPRAAATADEIAAQADFFSFGTNDLTQTTFGFSRDDAGKFLPFYVSEKILPQDPFVSLDQGGVGKLIEMGARLGREARPGLKLGICGEHGGDPDSVEFCHRLGMDYVSCSPYRVPIARLAAAQAVVREKGKK